MAFPASSKAINQTQAFDDFSSSVLGPYFSEYNAHLVKITPFDHTMPIIPMSSCHWKIYHLLKVLSQPFALLCSEKIVIHSRFVEWTNYLRGCLECQWRETGIFDAIQLYQQPIYPNYHLNAARCFWSSHINAFLFRCGLMTPLSWTSVILQV